MITNGLSSFKGRRVLLLQGPIGPFFKRFSLELKSAGCEVFKINFNGGDFVFFPTSSTQYLGDADEWHVFFEHFVRENKIDLIFLFGDCRPIHKAAHGIAKSIGIEVGVFEEGYIRPDYITLERDGVNGNSTLPQDAKFYQAIESSGISKVQRVGNTYWYMVIWAVIYYICSTLLFPMFRSYTHHRPLSIFEAWPWLKSIWRKRYYRVKEKGVQETLVTELHKRFFLVPLQVHNDSQIHDHSPFYSVADFIKTVMESFASHAPRDSYLVVKHHPMDRGYHDYTKLIHNLAEEYKLQSRVFYIHDQHLPSLLDAAQGVVVVNSTVGLSAIQRLVPVKACGDCVYGIDNIVFTGSLATFWQAASSFEPNKPIVDGYVSYLVEKTQLNGSFYRGQVLF